MAFTRKYLKELGIEPEMIDLIIDAHVDAMDGLKAERDELKEQVTNAGGLQKKVDDLTKQVNDGNDWKTKFETVSKEFETYKTAEAERTTKAAKESAYKALLKESNVSDAAIELIMKGTDLSSIEMEGDSIKNKETLTSQIASDYKAFIVQANPQGVQTQTPPSGSDQTPDLEHMTMSDYIKARRR